MKLRRPVYLLSLPSGLLFVDALSRSYTTTKRRRPLSQRRGDPVSIERDLVQQQSNKAGRGYTAVIGSDESGTGSIAGPIVAASCCIKDALSSYEPIEGVNDSKLLSAESRERIYRHIVNHPEKYEFKVATRSNQEIDASTALGASLDAIQETIESVAGKLEHEKIYSIVDGHRSPKVSMPSRPWKQGDATVYTVALASILARVTRDQIMNEMADKYPEYKFDQNGGYATAKHVQALHQFGPSPIHRKSCKPVKGRELTTRKTFLASLTMAATMIHSKEATAMKVDPKTGIALPDVGEIRDSVPKDWSGVDNPFEDDAKSLFGRLDSSSDVAFYKDPRFVEHVDSQAVQLMTEYISNVAIQPSTQSVLDICSSWTSHIKAVDRPIARVAGLGMNAKELEANPALTEWTVQDLNEKPILPYENNSFDVILCQLSIDYLTRPLEVCKEMGRVLKPGGMVHILFSNRLFLSKAVALWTGADDIDHTFTVASYLHFCNGGFDNIEAQDLSVRKGKRIVGDPLYVVTATKG